MILHRFALLSVVDAVVANLMLVHCGFRAPIWDTCSERRLRRQGIERRHRRPRPGEDLDGRHL